MRRPLRNKETQSSQNEWKGRRTTLLKGVNLCRAEGDVREGTRSRRRRDYKSPVGGLTEYYPFPRGCSMERKHRCTLETDRSGRVSAISIQGGVCSQLQPPRRRLSAAGRAYALPLIWVHYVSLVDHSRCSSSLFFTNIFECRRHVARHR